ncbi:hypothetical protein AAY473_015913 [Plecturocebus cupreus]
MGPAEPIRPAHSAPGSAALGAGKRAAPAKRVAPATRVASPPGISRSVGNKNSSEKTRFCIVAQAGLKFLGSSDPPAKVTSSLQPNGALDVFPNRVSLLLPRLECNGDTIAHYSPDFQGSGDPPTSAS